MWVSRLNEDTLVGYKSGIACQSSTKAKYDVGNYILYEHGNT